MIYLPFADDFRKVKFEEQPKGETKQKFKRFFVKLKYFIQIILLQMQIFKLKKKILHVMALPYNEHVIEFWYINPFF